MDPGGGESSGAGEPKTSSGGSEEEATGEPTQSSPLPPPPPSEHPTPPSEQPPPPSTSSSSSSQPQPSRYESQKRRDWNTFLQYLKSHKPPLTLARCSGAHVIEFLKYLDQFGKTKVHAQGCAYFGQPNPPAPCACPLKQAWGSLDALIGRLRAAFEENGGLPEANPFGARPVRIYLREVRESQAKARGIPYEKKKRKRVSSDPPPPPSTAPTPLSVVEAGGRDQCSSSSATTPVVAAEVSGSTTPTTTAAAEAARSTVEGKRSGKGTSTS